MAGSVALLVVLLIALYVCWLMFQPFFNVLLWAAVLCVVFYPMHRRILTRTGKPSLAAALSTLLVVLLILLPVTAVTVAVVRSSAAALRHSRRRTTRGPFHPAPRARWISSAGTSTSIVRPRARS